MTPAAAPFDEDLKSLIVDEPGKLFGQTADEQLFGSRPKGAPAPKCGPNRRLKRRTTSTRSGRCRAWSCRTSAAWRRSAASGRRTRRTPFDYGVGGIVKKAVYATAFAAVIWEVYINSPFFERAAPPPAVTAVQEEMSKYSRPPPAWTRRSAEPRGGRRLSRAGRRSNERFAAAAGSGLLIGKTLV